jgi:hypothetical protein
MGKRNPNRLWTEIIATSVTAACAIAFFVAMVASIGAGIAGEPALAQADSAPQQFEGMLTCSRCGAKHSAVLGRNAADCVRACARLGAAFALISGDKVYQLEGDPTVLKQLAARRVQVVGMVQGTTIRVSSVKAE